MGAPRIATTMRVGTRVDRPVSIADKIKSVEDKLLIFVSTKTAAFVDHTLLR